MANDVAGSSAVAQDAIGVEVFANLFKAVVDEMAWVVLRSSHTTFVKETQDFGVALVTPEGEMFAYPYGSGATVLMGVAMDSVTRTIDWQEGDVVITNDPYSTRGMVMHLNDIYVFRPIFIDGNLLCFAWAFIHCTDVGGYAPGSIDMQNSEVFQEGLRMRPVKLFRHGELNEDVWNLFADNCRIPSLNWGDMTACVAALSKAETRLRRLVERYGRTGVQRAMYAPRSNRGAGPLGAVATAARLLHLHRIFRGRLHQRCAGAHRGETDRARGRDRRTGLPRLRPARARGVEPADRQHGPPPVPGDVGGELCRHQIGSDSHQRRHPPLHRSGTAGSLGGKCQLPGRLRHAVHDGDAGARSDPWGADKGDAGRGAGRRVGRPGGDIHFHVGTGRRRTG